MITELTAGFLNKDFCEKEYNKEIVCKIKTFKQNEFITRVEACIKNNGELTNLIPFFQIVRNYQAEFFMIPCVNYNGNKWGNGNEPKGDCKDGKPWVFSSDRVGVPGCSIIENDVECRAIFADNKGASKNASASVFFKDGKTFQRVYFSHLEQPCVFLRKFVYGDAITEFLTFKKGEEKVFVFYLYEYTKPKKGERYGYNELFDYLNGGSYYTAIPQKYNVKKVKEFSGEFIRSLTEEYGDGYLSNMGLLPNGEHRLGDENSKFLYRKGNKYEIGWCGQNITVAETYLRAYLESKNEDYLNKGLGIFNNWLKRQYPCGLISANYDVPFDCSESIDSCNEGWFIYKAIICLPLLKQIGIDAQKGENAIKKVCDFYLDNYPTGGFPQILNANGKVKVREGCAGVMVMLGLIEGYKYFKNSKYLARAKSAFEFYYGTYLSNSVAAGGALDTYCIDKESAGPVLRSALLLYELTGEDRYLNCANNIAHYLMTWAFYHDVEFDKDTDCYACNLKTTGGTAVSVAHHHIDCWGLFYVPDLYELYKLTGKKSFLNHAQALWTFTVQYISDGNMKLHGMVRPIGAQNEGVLQCNWHAIDEKKGQLNDWLVTWVNTFKLDVIYALEKTDFFCLLK